LIKAGKSIFIYSTYWCNTGWRDYDRLYCWNRRNNIKRIAGKESFIDNKTGYGSKI